MATKKFWNTGVISDKIFFYPFWANLIKHENSLFKMKVGTYLNCAQFKVMFPCPALDRQFLSKFNPKYQNYFFKMMKFGK